MMVAGVIIAIVVAVGALGDRGDGAADRQSADRQSGTAAGAPPSPSASASASASAPSPGPSAVLTAPRASDGVDLLAGVQVLRTRASAPVRYRRDAFGSAWTDNTDAPGGHNGCDTRNDILQRDLTDKTYKRTSGCPNAVATGVLVDPYTGGTIDFVRGVKTSADVQIDHIVPLAYSWDMGAWNWDEDTRRRFANDPRNLLASDGPANNNKRDSPPGRWMPSNEGFHCQYVEEFAFVTREYALAIDAGSASVIREVASRC